MKLTMYNMCYEYAETDSPRYETRWTYVGTKKEGAEHLKLERLDGHVKDVEYIKLVFHNKAQIINHMNHLSRA